MHEKTLTLIGGACGMIGGLFKFVFLQIQPNFLINLVQAGVTALCCGLLGVAGKEAYGLIKKIVIKKLIKRKIKSKIIK